MADGRADGNADGSVDSGEARFARQAAQCREWDADPDHQRQAGRARAARGFTRAWQQAAAHARNDQLAAVFRAEQGLPPLNPEWVRRYVTPEQIRDPFGRPLPEALQARIYRAWCAGSCYGVACWLNDPAWADAVEAELDRAAHGMAQPALPLG